MRGGVVASKAHTEANTVPMAEYLRVCDECERMSGLYYAERKRNVRLTGNHAPSAQLIK